MMSKPYNAKYMLFDSVGEMLSPKTLSHLLKRSVSQVTCRPFEPSSGFSGNQLFHVNVDGRKLVMKRMRPAVDWIAIATNDNLCRSIRVWQYGLLDCIQPHMQHGRLAACRDGDDYAILMQDVSHALVKWRQRVSPKIIHSMLDALAAMHAMFWEDENLKAAELGLCNAESLITFGWPIQWDHYRHQSDIVDMLKRGWDAFFDIVEPDVRDALQSLMENPQPLYAALSDYPSTFVHADYRVGNLALLPDTKECIVLDWQLAGYAPATICACWFVMSGGAFVRQEAYSHYYHQRLSGFLGNRFDQSLWQPMLELGGLVDGFRKGPWHALFSARGKDEGRKAYFRQSVDMYNDIVRKGLTWL